jgi:hypothetical protein
MTLVPKAKPPTTIHHKKRSGEHHRQSKHYGKAYWPYLPLLVIVGVGLLVNAFWSHQGTSVLGYATDVSASSLLTDTNTQRNADNEAGLTLSNVLSSAAQAKANDMAKRNYWSHDTPDGATPWSFITKAGYNYEAAGENLAYGFNSSSAILNGWMHSTEHRANILNGNFKQVGFGIANAPNYQGTGPETIVVAMYAEPVTITAASSPTNNTSAKQKAVSSTVGITSPARDAKQPPAQRVARIQTFNAGAAPWTLFAISTLSALAMVWFLMRHGLFWHRALVKSEAFVVHHKFLDVTFISIATLGFILTRTAGMIH